MICERTQGYYENLNGIYGTFNPPMKGHGALDIHCGFGSEIESPLDGKVYKIIDDKRPANDGSGFWAIFMLCTYKGQLGELCVGHCSKINVEVGDEIKAGQVIGLEGNKGIVFEGGVRITKEMQDKGDKRGSHRHWQWRPVRLVKNTLVHKQYLSGNSSYVYRDKEDCAYEVLDYNNGFHGLSPEIANIFNDYIPSYIPEISYPTSEERKKIKTMLDYIQQIINLLKLWKK